MLSLSFTLCVTSTNCMCFFTAMKLLIKTEKVVVHPNKKLVFQSCENSVKFQNINKEVKYWYVKIQQSVCTLLHYNTAKLSTSITFLQTFLIKPSQK